MKNADVSKKKLSILQKKYCEPNILIVGPEIWVSGPEIWVFGPEIWVGGPEILVYWTRNPGLLDPKFQTRISGPKPVQISAPGLGPRKAGIGPRKAGIGPRNWTEKSRDWTNFWCCGGGV